MADAHRVGNDLGIQRAGHRPLVVLQYGTVGGAVEQGLGLLFRKLLRRDVVVGDFAVAVGADKRLQLFGGGRTGAPTSATLFSSASMSSSVGETSNTTYESARDGVCLNMFLWLL